MNIILLQSKISIEDLDQLLYEFPQFLFLVFNRNTYKNLSKQDWAKVEIIFGNCLTKEELAAAPQLHWIHSPTPSLSRLCMTALEKKESILITNTKGENIAQMGEYAIGGMLAFAKNFFHWKERNTEPGGVWDSHWRHAMWTLDERHLLQIGLGRTGTEITRRAQQMGMQVWGVQELRSFHPYCEKVIAAKDLHSVLPTADVVSLCLPRGREYDGWFDADKIALMKEDTILVILGSHRVVDEGALYKAALEGKFRGILLDAFYEAPIPPSSKLWKIPDIIITPEVAPRPKIRPRQAFRTFRYNLRQYLHGNYTEMRNLILPQ